MMLDGIKLSQNLLLRNECLYFDRYVVFDYINHITEHIDCVTLNLLKAIQEMDVCEDCFKSAIDKYNAGISFDSLFSRDWIQRKKIINCSHDFAEKISLTLKSNILEKKQKRKVAFMSAPTAVTLLITQRCNLRCIHCNVSANNISSKDMLDLHILKRILDELEEMGVWKVVLSGGEPLAHTDIDCLLEYFARKKYAKALLTNGTLLNEDRANLLKEGGIIPILSLDGGNADTHDKFRGVTGSFDLLLNTLYHLANKKIPYSLTTVIHSGNIDQLWDIAKIAKKYYANRITFSSLKPIGRGRNSSKRNDAKLYQHVIKEIQKISEVYPAIRIEMEDSYGLDYLNQTYFNETKFGFTSCSAATDTLVVHWDGNVYPCMLAAQLRAGEAGNIANKHLKEIWNSKDWGVFREPIKSGCRAFIFFEKNKTEYPDNGLSGCCTA